MARKVSVVIERDEHGCYDERSAALSQQILTTAVEAHA
jgi:hypothetical protein